MFGWGSYEDWRRYQEHRLRMSAQEVTPPEEQPDNREALKVIQWRRIYLERAGYDAEAAMLIGESSVDLHKAAALIEHGCDTTTALRILL